MPDPSAFGISDQLSLKYMGPNVNFIPIRALPHRPTIYDKNYPIGQMAILNKNPTTGTEGELWYLSKFIAGAPDWKHIAVGTGTNTVDIVTTDDGLPSVVPDVNSNVNIVGGANIVTSGQAPGSTITISATGVANSFTTDDGAPAVVTSAVGNVNIIGAGATTVTGQGPGNTITITSPAIPASVLTVTTDSGAPAVVPTGAGNISIVNGNGLSSTGVGPGSTVTLGIAAPVSIANGGTNAVVMSTATGIVKYSGTALVTSTTAMIDAQNIYTNTSQPAFLYRQVADTAGVTGEGTAYVIGSGVNLTQVFDRAHNFNVNGTFTAPVTGVYLFICTFGIGNITAASHGSMNWNFTAGTIHAVDFNPVNMFNAGNGIVALSASIINLMNAGETLTVSVGTFGEAGPLPTNIVCGNSRTYIGGFLLA